MNALSPASAAVPERALTPGLLAMLAGLAAIGTLSTNILLPSFPSIALAMDVPARDLGLLLSAFFLAFAGGQLFVGPLSDRYGRKSFVLGGLLVFALGSLVCSFAGNMALLITGRVIQAVGVCAASVLSRAIARDLFQGDALARTLALTMVAMAAAPGFSPLLGSALESGPGWRAGFVIIGAIGAVLALAYAWSTGETLPAARRSAMTLRTTLSAYASLGRDARFILPAVAVALIIGGLYAFFAATPAILMGRLGFTAFQLGLFFAGTVLIVFASGLLAPALARRWQARRVGAAGIVIALSGGLLLLSAGDQSSAPVFFISITVFLAGMGLVNPLGTALALNPFERQAGLASALLGCVQMGSAAGMTALVASLPVGPTVALGLILSVASVLALGCFATYLRSTK